MYTHENVYVLEIERVVSIDSSWLIDLVHEFGYKKVFFFFFFCKIKVFLVEFSTNKSVQKVKAKKRKINWRTDCWQRKKIRQICLRQNTTKLSTLHKASLHRPNRESHNKQIQICFISILSFTLLSSSVPVTILESLIFSKINLKGIFI